MLGLVERSTELRSLREDVQRLDGVLERARAVSFEDRPGGNALLDSLAAAWGDGWVRRRIRQSGFAYASPLAHAYALRGIVVVVVLSGLVLFLPLPLPALGVPVVGALVAVLVGIIVANAQKRL